MERLNKALYKIMLGINIVLIFAYLFFGIIKMRPMDICIIAISISLVSFIVIFFTYKKMSDSEKFRYIVLATNTAVYFTFVFLSGVNNGYMVGMVVSFIYIFYMDIRLCKLLALSVTFMTGSFLAYCYVKGSYPEGNAVLMKSVALIMGSVMVFDGLLIFATRVAIMISDNQLESIKESELKAKELMDNMVDISKLVGKSVREGVDNISELNNSIDGTNDIFKKIADRNANNVNSVEVQTEMTMKITELIDNVVEDSNDAKVYAIESIEGLDNSKKILNEVKFISDEIIDVNKELLNAINEFVSNVKDVKAITDGIHDISDQTNLLSLNASIESAKAGEVGKGFAVVATEVRKLSEETSVLTAEIEEIVKVLESDAIEAQDIIYEVEESIEDENNTINETMYKFDGMEDKMNELKIGMNNILGSTKDVVSYNNNIMEHIEQLSAQTEEVTAYIEEVLAINGTNKDKANKTKLAMEELKEKVNVAI